MSVYSRLAHDAISLLMRSNKCAMCMRCYAVSAFLPLHSFTLYTQRRAAGSRSICKAVPYNLTHRYPLQGTYSHVHAVLTYQA
jgi:hypothetical protein